MAERVEGQENQKAYRSREYIIFVGILIALFIARYLFGAGREILNVDERELMASILDRLTGTPSTALAWPAATVQMLLLPVAAVKALLSGGFGSGIAGLYSSPFDWTMLARSVLLVVSLGFATVAWRKVKESDNSQGAFIGFLLVVASPIYLFQSYLVTGDGIGVWAMMAAFAYVLYERQFSRALLIGGVLIGFAIGSRVGFAMYVPLIFVLGWMRRGESDSAWGLVKWLGIGLLAGVLVFMPYLWTDPTRLLKSVLGNAGRGGGESFSGHLMQGAIQSGIWVWVVAVIGVLMSKGKQRVVGSIALGYSGLMFLGLCKLGVVYDRYFILVLPGIAVAVMYASGSWVADAPKKAVQAFSSGLVGAIAVAMFVITTAEEATKHNAEDFRAMVVQLKDEEVVYASKSVFYEMDYRLVERDALRRIRDQQIVALGQSLAGKGEVSHPMMNVLPWAFREDEQAFIGRLTTVIESGSEGVMNLELVETDPALSARIGIGMINVENMPEGAPVLLDVKAESSALKLEKNGVYDGVKFYLYRVQR